MFSCLPDSSPTLKATRKDQDSLTKPWPGPKETFGQMLKWVGDKPTPGHLCHTTLGSNPRTWANSAQPPWAPTTSPGAMHEQEQKEKLPLSSFGLHSFIFFLCE